MTNKYISIKIRHTKKYFVISGGGRRGDNLQVARPSLTHKSASITSGLLEQRGFPADVTGLLQFPSLGQSWAVGGHIKLSPA